MYIVCGRLKYEIATSQGFFSQVNEIYEKQNLGRVRRPNLGSVCLGFRIAQSSGVADAASIRAHLLH